MTQQHATSGTTASELAARLRALYRDGLPPAAIATSGGLTTLTI